MEKASAKWEGKVAVLGVVKTFWLKEPVVGVAEGLGKFQSTELGGREIASANMGSDRERARVFHGMSHLL